MHAAEDPRADDTDPVQDRALTRSRMLAWWGLWMVVAAVVVLPYAHTYHHLSPFDEAVHIDYVVKAQHFDLVEGGDKIGPVAMRASACRRSDLDTVKQPGCHVERLDPDLFPQAGFNTAYADPPLYYWVTAPVSAVLLHAPGGLGAVTAMRSVGVLWLGAGLAVTFLLARRLGASDTAAAGAALVLATAPTVAHSSATVTSDSPEVLVGALLCLVALGVVEGRTRWWWLLPVALAAGYVKATSLVAFGVVAVYLLLHLYLQRAEMQRSSAPRDGPEAPGAALAPRRTLWLSLAAVVVGGLFSIGSWSVLTALTASSAADTIAMSQAFHVDHLEWNANIAPNLFALVSPLQIGYLPPVIASLSLVAITTAGNLVLLLGVFGTAWRGPHHSEASRLGIAAAAGMLLGGLGFVALLYVGSHSWILIPPRYGLGLVGAGFAVLAVAASRRRAGEWGLVALGLLSMLGLLVQTL